MCDAQVFWTYEHISNYIEVLNTNKLTNILIFDDGNPIFDLRRLSFSHCSLFAPLLRDYE